MFLDDGVGALADGLEGFIEGEEHDDGGFVSVIAAEETENEGDDEHGGATGETGMEIIGVGDVLGGIGDLESTAAVNADDIKDAGGGKGKGEDAGVVDAIEAGGEHEEEKRGEIPASGADKIPDEITAESGGGEGVSGIF